MTVIAGDSAAASGTSPNPTTATSVRPALCRARTSAIVHGTFEENTAVGASGSVRRPTSLAADSSGDPPDVQTRSGRSSRPASATASR